MCGIFRKMTARSLRARSRNFYFVETVVTGRTDLIFVRYSLTSSGLPSNNPFRIQGRSCMRKYVQCLCTDFDIFLTLSREEVRASGVRFFSFPHADVIVCKAGLDYFSP
jgi:hypothetical protein